MSQPAGRRRATATILAGTGANTLLAAIQSIVLVPFYLELIGPRLYGAWLATGDLLLWIQLFDFGIPNLLIQRVGAAKAGGDERRIGEYFAASLLILTIIAAGLGFAAYAVAPLVPGVVGLSGADAEQLTTAFRWAAIAAATVIVTNTVLGLSRGIQKPAMLSAFSVGGTFAGIVVTVAGLFAEWGLFAIASGLMARAAVILVGSAAFTVREWRTGLAANCRIRRQTLVDVVKATPSTTLGSMAYSLNHQCENFLVAVVLRPEVVPILSVTRRAVDVARTLLDTIGYSSYGAFAHLVRSADRAHVQRVRHELLSIRFALAAAAATAFIIANRSFVSVWVGPEFFAGAAVSALFGWQLLIGGQSFLTNYLYRAAGRVEEGSWILAGEGVVRVVLSLIALRAFGLVGLAVASTFVSAVALWANTSRLNALLRYDTPSGELVTRYQVLTMVGIGAATAVAPYLFVPSWQFVISAVAVSTLAVIIPAVAKDPALATVRLRITGMFPGMAHPSRR